ncbi:uncharacterized protein FIBRA_02712 [Fibroporia radiculosa]|uniref:Major facilitator superfamily (MFS) profile domain-containing protein n=1 Tax=Fibroporia radiculosa TaxID=599839 RepID=J4G2F5_9APHY|nr:uncharacterized protein FIBRA_02712 [Fibroporia radiculosa]CCM00673.1 predicted protein [Fibroporia radiculosa]
MAADEETPLLGETAAQQYNADDVQNGQEGSQETPAQEPKSPPILMVIMPMMLSIFLVAMDVTIVTSTYAHIGSQFERLESTSWITTGYMLTVTSFQPLYGKLSDIFGRKPCLLFSIFVFALGCFLCGIARDMTMLIFGRAIAGIGGGGISIVTNVIMSDVVPLRDRGSWQGFGNVVWASGQALGAPLGGILTETVGWRWGFLLQVPLSFLAMVVFSLGFKTSKTSSSDFSAKLKRIDFGGAATLIVAVFALLLGLDRGGNIAWSDSLTIAYLVIFAVFTCAFCYTEWRLAKEPFVPLAILTERTLLAANGVAFFTGATVAILFLVAMYLQAVQGLDPASVGSILIPAVVGGASGSVVSGFIIRASGRYYALAAILFVFYVFGMVSVVCVSGLWTFSLIALSTAMVVMNVGGWGGSTAAIVALVSTAGPENQAVAIAVFGLFRSLGSVVILSVATALFQQTLRIKLYARLSGDGVDEIIKHVRESLDYIKELDPASRTAVVRSYGDGLQIGMWFTAAMAMGPLLSALFIKEKAMSR